MYVGLSNSWGGSSFPLQAHTAQLMCPIQAIEWGEDFRQNLILNPFIITKQPWGDAFESDSSFWDFGRMHPKWGNNILVDGLKSYCKFWQDFYRKNMLFPSESHWDHCQQRSIEHLSFICDEKVRTNAVPISRHKKMWGEMPGVVITLCPKVCVSWMVCRFRAR